MPTAVKLGGGLVADRDGPREGVIAGLAETVAAHRPAELVVVHGAGPRGHAAAAELGIDEGTGTRDIAAAYPLLGELRALNDAVVSALHGAGVDAVPVHPLSAVVRGDGGLSGLGAVDALVAEGLVPVLHGDICAHRGEGVSVVSGDELVCRAAGAEGRIGCCGDYPGVVGPGGAVLDRVSGVDEMAALDGDGADVTGGMRGKVERLLAADADGAIFGQEDLGAFLDGGWPGTRVTG